MSLLGEPAPGADGPRPAGRADVSAGKICRNCLNWAPASKTEGYCAVWETDTGANDVSGAFSPIGG